MPQLPLRPTAFAVALGFGLALVLPWLWAVFVAAVVFYVVIVIRP